jgi:hypothetical protein
MRAAGERRGTGRRGLSGLLFWVMDPPQALDARPGLPWLTDVAPLSAVRTETGKHLARLLPTGASGWCFLFASGNAHMYCGARRLAFEWA